MITYIYLYFNIQRQKHLFPAASSLSVSEDDENISYKMYFQCQIDLAAWNYHSDFVWLYL